jgi:hypothetical protein
MITKNEVGVVKGENGLLNKEDGSHCILPYRFYNNDLTAVRTAAKAEARCMFANDRKR